MDETMLLSSAYNLVAHKRIDFFSFWLSRMHDFGVSHLLGCRGGGKGTLAEEFHCEVVVPPSQSEFSSSFFSFKSDIFSPQESSLGRGS